MSAVFSRCPWGRNECLTNEPQRTSAGRLFFGLIKTAASCLIILQTECTEFQNVENSIYFSKDNDSNFP